MYTLVTQEGDTPRTRYFERATLLIKREVLMLLLAPFLIGTKDMIADIFTKALDKGSFIKFRNIIMNHDTPLKEALSAAVCGMHACTVRPVVWQIVCRGACKRPRMGVMKHDGCGRASRRERCYIR